MRTGDTTHDFTEVTMRPIRLVLLAFTLAAALAGCALPPVLQPLRLYDLEDGSTIEVFLRPTGLRYGTIVSRRGGAEEYHGEYSFVSDRLGAANPRPGPYGNALKQQTPPQDFADAYGFGKDSRAEPVGTGILVGGGKVIEIVFFRLSRDLDSGDGVGRDNNGRYYRIFLSTEAAE
jgi:hypothetical protein